MSIPRARAWGIEPGFTDYRGEWRDTPPETERALLDAMEAENASPPPSDVIVVRVGERLDLDGSFDVHLEDGSESNIGGRERVRLAPGYHKLVDASGERSLIVSPGVCHLPESLHTWGWGTQVYALHSAHSWGIGDLGDLAQVGRWARKHGAGALLLNPLHAAAPEQASPYFPSSRCFRNPIYIDVEAVAAEMNVALDPTEGRALTRTPTIEREAVYEVKMSALERLWDAWSGSDDFDRYETEAGGALTRFAEHAARSEGKAATTDRVRFHKWLQWLVRSQLATVEAEIDIVHDLAIGVDPTGADAAIWAETFARDVHIGAPPDEFTAEGQDWAMPPFDPWKLRASGYEPFIRTVRSALSSGAGVRVDHVMGLFRLWWIPQGASATEGAYVRYPKDDLLNILALESHRAGSFVIGEDLGTVEPSVRDEMVERNMLSYRVMWFEASPPAHFPELALAAVTNHDLPTIAGLWTGEDAREQKEIGLEVDDEGESFLHARLSERVNVDGEAAVEEVIVGAYTALGEAPSRVKIATLEDAFAVTRRPNQPGTTDERPNWALRLPLPVESFDETPLPARIARALKS